MKRITILLLAAGQSRRTGQNKLLLPFQGQSVLRRTAMSLIENNFKNILVVTGHESARAHAALERLPVEWVHNSDQYSGLLSSVKAGIKACSETTDAVRTLNFPASKESEDLGTPEDYAKLTQEEADSETKSGSEFESESGLA